MKFSKIKNSYVDVGAKKAREKVGHLLRDLLNSKSERGRSTWKECAKKTNTSKCDEPVPMKTTSNGVSFSVLDVVSGAYNRRRASSLVSSIDHIEDLLSEDAILMESCDFNLLLDCSEVSFADIFDA